MRAARIGPLRSTGARRWRTAAGIGALSLLLVPARAAQQEPRAPAPREPALTRVVVIGASLSAGFGLARGLDAALEASLVGAHEAVRSEASELLFLDPLHSGPAEVRAALEAEPTLVVALDYLFWFGYGAIGASGEALASEEERLALLERGLHSLEELECPLVLCDFPDMSAAVGKMISAAQMPELATLARLSKRVREWAAKRGNTLVLPLSELARALDSGAAIRIGRHEFPTGSRLLQADELHPTLEGLAALAQLVADELVRAELAREADFSFELAGVLARLRAPLRPAVAPDRR